MLKKIISNSFFYFITTALIKLSMLIISIFVSRYTNKEIFGQYMLIRSTISTFELISLFGMNQTSIKFIAQNNNKNNIGILEITLTNILYITLFSSMLFSSMIFIYSNTIVNYFFNSSDYILILSVKYSGLLLFFSMISVILSSILNGFEKYKDLAITNLLAISLFVVPTFYLIFNFQLVGGIIGVIIFFLFSSVFKAYKIFTHMKDNKIKINYRINIKSIFNMIKFTLPVFFSIVLIIPIFWYSKTLLMNYNNDAFNEIAVFEASYQWLTIILVITGAVTNVSLALFSKLINNDDLIKALFLNLFINISISILLSIIFIYFSKYLLLIYGEEYNDTYLLKLLLISSIPFTAYSIINRFFISVNKIWYNFYLSILWSILFLGYIYIDIENINGLIIAKSFLLSYSSIFIISFILLLIQNKEFIK